MGRKKKLATRPKPKRARSIPEPRPVAEDPFERFSFPLLIVTGLAIFGIYVPTLYPSVPGGDSGELIVASYRLGVAHPPGYPLYTMLGKLFSAFPVGALAWRLNLMTALFGAVAATVLTRATWTLTRNFGAGLMAGGLFAFSPLVWRYSIQAEVFSLNSLFVAILLSSLVSFERERGGAKLVWFCFWFGLGLTHHHTLLFIGAPIGAWMLWRVRRDSMRWPRIVKLPAFGLLGMSPYLYLFVSPADHPSTTWGDTSTLPGFVTHLLRRQYGTFQLGTSERGGSLGERLTAFLAQLPGELLWIGPALALVGVGVAFLASGSGPRVRVLRVVVVTLVFYLVVFGSLTGISLEDPFWHEIHARFWQQANLIVCLLAGAGLAWLARPALTWAPIATLAVALPAFGLQVGVNRAAQDHGQDRAVSDFAEALLRPLPQDALLITKGDLYWNAVRYKQVCEGIRPDVRILDLELLKAPWMKARVERHLPDVHVPGAVYRAPAKRTAGSYDLEALFAANVGRLPVFSNALDHGDASWSQGHTSWPEGLVDRIAPKGTPLGVDAWLERTDRWIGQTELHFLDDVPPGSWEHIVRETYRKVESRRGSRLLAEVVGKGLGDDYLRRTGAILEQAASMRDEPPAPVYLNLGIVYYLLRGKEPRAVEKMVEAWTVYQRVAPADAPERALVARALADPEGADIGIGSR
jgi:hypothetical protein